MMFVSNGEVIYMIFDCFTIWKAQEDIKEQALTPQILSGNSILSASQKTHTSISSQDLTDLKRQYTYS